MNSLMTFGLCLVWLLFAPITYADNKKNSLESLRPITVYKSLTCGCCEEWVKHLKSADFAVRIRHPENLDSIKQTLNISPQYQACHTGVKSGYYFEGHVPAEVIQHFLEESPEDAAGLAVPGMPMGSPGMDVDGKYRPYEVLQINKNGSSSTYARVSIEGIIYSKQNNK